MNRLIIIGNGFDLAHGLPTSYRDFIDDYWRGITSEFDIYSNKSNYEDEFVKIVYEFDSKITVFYDITPQVQKINNYYDFKNFIIKYSKGNSQNLYRNGCLIDFKNNFFKNICELHSVQNWVDIENEYYKKLKDIINPGISDLINFNENEKKITKLNREFDKIKSLLKKYLENKVEANNNSSRYNKKEILKIFENNIYSEESLNDFYKELSKKASVELDKLIQKDFEKKRMTFNFNDLKKTLTIENFFLSFNYTHTIRFYQQMLNINNEKINEIHGSLYDEENPINFGFGDEMDNDYKQIEDKNDNEYLKNIKSFQYLHTSNYKRLLDLIDSEVFQVYIIGHSCGLSDRTLLNTIFEHENCCSIKIYYHQKEDGSDNYTEITQNISRHFNKKKLMREKIVNKTLCQPLPQIQLPKKV